MKNLKTTLITIAVIVSLSASCRPRLVESTPEPLTSGLIVLSVTGDNVRVRACPQVHNRSDILAMLNTGDVVIAEKWTITEGDNTWYRIVGIVNKESGQAVDVLQVLPEAKTYPFISTSYVQPLDNQNAEQEFLTQISSTPYCEGFSVVDYSAIAQRKMVEQNTIQLLLTPWRGAPVYSKPSATSDIKGYYLEERKFDYDLMRIDSLSGWFLVIDLANIGPSGWMEADKMSGYGRDELDIRCLAHIHLGANIAEIMSRLGTGEVVKRSARGGEYGGIDNEREYYDVDITTEITANGFELIFKDFWDIEVTITRPGAGLIGIFVGVDWCNKEYIEKNFGAFDIDKNTGEDGVEKWTVSKSWDGWYFDIYLDFDRKGRVSKFKYDANSIALWH